MNLVGTLSNPVKTEVNVNANVNILILSNNRETRGWMAWSLLEIGIGECLVLNWKNFHGKKNMQTLQTGRHLKGYRKMYEG